MNSQTIQLDTEELPKPKLVRDRIENCPDEEIRKVLMCEYLYAGRISEVVGVNTPRDRSTARGPKGTDARVDLFSEGPINEEAIVFSVRTAKRGGKVRSVGLPIKYEPWAVELYDYFQEKGDRLVFPFTRQKVWADVKEMDIFDGLTYRIMKYNLWTNGKIEKEVFPHDRDFALHALRHVRATELVSMYKFKAPDIAVYGGWTLKTAGFGGSLDRYLSLDWTDYFLKLLRPV